MKRIILFTGILIGSMGIPSGNADIYTWVDDNGIRHYSNRSPQSGAKIFLQTDLFTKTRTNTKKNNEPLNPSHTTNSQTPTVYNDLALESPPQETPIPENPTYEKPKKKDSDNIDAVSNLQEQLEETLKQVEGLENKLRGLNDSEIYARAARDHPPHKFIRSDREYHHYYGRRYQNSHKRRQFMAVYPKNHRNPHYNKSHNSHGGRYGQYKKKNQTPKSRHFQSTLNRSRRLGVYSTRSQIRKNRQSQPVYIKNRAAGVHRHRHGYHR